MFITGVKVSLKYPKASFEPFGENHNALLELNTSSEKRKKKRDRFMFSLFQIFINNKQNPFYLNEKSILIQ